MDEKTRKKFTELAWQDLEDWAGTRVVSRGKGYKGAVEDLKTTGDNCLVAWVHGTRKYATKVCFDHDGELESREKAPQAA